MKALLLLSVLLSGVLAITAAAVEAPEAVKVVEAPEAVKVVEAPEAVEAAPQELQEINQNEDPQMVSTGEITSPGEGRFSSCPSGWTGYSDSCYRVVRLSKTWSDAASYCSSQRATLASGHDAFEYNFLQLLTSQAGYSVSWLGGFYFQGWRWLDNSPFYDWSAPNSASSYPCIYLRTSANWYNTGCGTRWPFICVRRIGGC